MKKVLTAIFLAAFVFLLTACNAPPVALRDCKEEFELSSDYKLVFEDNFDTLDLTKWKIMTFGNHLRRAGYYVDSEDVVSVSDGALKLSSVYRDGIMGEGFYTAWLESSALGFKDGGAIHDENYTGFQANRGYFEVRCIPLKGVGIWSAFWMLPNAPNLEIGSADGAEIDIMESHFWPQEEIPNKMCHAIHVDESLGKLQSAVSKHYIIENFYIEYHTFGMEWREDKYIFNIDGKVTWETDHFKGTSQVDQFMILSIEVAGANNGIEATEFGANENNNPLQNDLTEPCDFYVDYVKVYQK